MLWYSVDEIKFVLHWKLFFFLHLFYIRVHFAVYIHLIWYSMPLWDYACAIYMWAATWENQQCGFWPGLTQTRLYCYWRWLEAWNFGFRKYRYCIIQVAKTKALISFAVTAKLICVFVFAYADCWFSHDAAHVLWFLLILPIKIKIFRWEIVFFFFVFFLFKT